MIACRHIQTLLIRTVSATAFLSLAPALAGNVRLDPSGSFSVRWWTVEDGLPQAPLTSLAIARDGAVWCASSATVMRFDGQIFSSMPDGTSEILHASIGTFIGLGFDGTGRLIAMGPKGIAIAPRTIDLPHTAITDWRIVQPPNSGLHQLFFDDDGIAYCVGQKTIFRLVDGALVEPPGMIPPVTFPFYGAALDHQVRDLWIWGWGKTRRVANGIAHDDAPSLEKRVISMAAGPTGLWAGLVDLSAGTVDGAAVLRSGTWQEFAMPTKPRTPTREGHIREGVDGTVWLATHASFHALRKGQWTPVVEGLSDFALATQDMETDRRGFLWAACKGGLVSLGPTRLWVAPLPPVSVVFECHDGTRLAGRPGEIIEIIHRPTLERPLALSHRATLPANVVPTCIAETAGGTIFVGSRDTFVYRIDDDGVNIVTQTPGVAMEVRNVSALVCDSADRVWAGTDNGLAEYDPTSRSFRFVSGFGDSAPTPVLGLSAEHDGTLLVATQGRGIDRLAADGRWIREVPADLMPGRRMIRFCRTPDGTRWIAGDSGLLRWDRTGNKTLIDQRHGLVERAIVQVIADEAGRLWLVMRDGHVQGIRVRDLDGLAAGRRTAVRGIVVGPLDGIGERELLAGSCFLDNQIMLLSTLGGLATIDTSSLGPPDVEPHRHIVSIEKTAMDGLTGFRFSAVTTDTFDPPIYQTRLSGIDSDWSPPSPVTERAYASLPPGRHRFEARHVRGDDVTAYPSAALEIDVPTPFWQTGWFIGLLATSAATLAGGAAALVSRLVSRRRMAAIERERERERDRVRIARDIHDSLGAGLTQMALMSDLLRQAARGHGNINAAAPGVTLDDLYESARLLTRSVDEIVWAVNPANDSLDRFMTFVAHDVESMARSGGLELSVHIPNEFPETMIPSHVRHHVCMIVREAVANVLKHANASHLTFFVAIHRDGLEIQVTDDGVGITNLSLPDAMCNGLDNMRSRAAECAGELVVDTAPGRGVRITVRVPLDTGGKVSPRPPLRIHGGDSDDGPSRRRA